MSSHERPDPRRERIYRAIQILFTIDIALGLVLAVAGTWLIGVPVVAWTGLGLAAVGLILLLFFRYLAGKAALRKSR